MNTKLTPKEIDQLWNALPTKEYEDAIKAANAQLEKIYGEFVIKHLGYKTVEDAISDGFNSVLDSYTSKELAERLTNADYLWDVIADATYDPNA